MPSKQLNRLAGKYNKQLHPQDGSKGGFAQGDKHSAPSGGIAAEVGTERKPIKFEGGEVVITAPAVEDNTKREFNGKQMTNRQILSAINESGGGVSFAKGGKFPKKIKYRKGEQYKVGGKLMDVHQVVKHCGCGCKHEMEKGGLVTLDEKKILTAIRNSAYLKKQPKASMGRVLYEHAASKDPAVQKQVIKELREQAIDRHQLIKNVGYKIAQAVLKLNSSSFAAGCATRKTIPVKITDDGNSRAYFAYKQGGNINSFAHLQKNGTPDQEKIDFIRNKKTIRPFVPAFQMDYLTQVFNGEERSHAVEVAQQLADLITKMPKTYETEDQETDDKMVYLHYFYGGSDWYIVEKDKGNGPDDQLQQQAFGYVILNDDHENAEWGYISIEEIKSLNKIELDFHFTPKPFGEVKKKWQQEEEPAYENSSKPSEPKSDGSGITSVPPPPPRKFKIGDRVQLKPQYLKKEPTMQQHNEATIKEFSEYYSPETGWMYDTIIMQDLSPRWFYETELELITPENNKKEWNQRKDRDNTKRAEELSAEQPQTTNHKRQTFQAASTTAKQQTDINSQIRSLVKEKGTDRLKYSAAEIELLKQYEGAGAEKKTSTDARILDQFFTPMDICAKMWGLAFKHGYKFPGSSILESAVGSGRFLSFVPNSPSGDGGGCYVRAYDVDETSATICKVLYPTFDIRHGSFEQEFFKGRRHIGMAGVDTFYDLVIGNPPYREYVSEYAPLGEKAATGAFTFEMYFIARGVDVLKPGGLLIYIIPNTFMSNDSKYNDFKEKLAKKCDLVDAYRLPNGVFGNTDVGTDIIVLRKK